MDTDIGNTSDARKTAIINNEILRLKVDINDHQDLAGQGSIREKDFTFFWHDKSVDFTVNMSVVGNMVLT